MTFNELQRLITPGEYETLEFKKSTAQLPRIAEALCGFLNYQGGTVVVGVTDSGQIVGQHVNDGTRQEIAHMLSHFEPPAQIAVDYIPLPDNDRAEHKTSSSTHWLWVILSRSSLSKAILSLSGLLHAFRLAHMPL